MDVQGVTGPGGAQIVPPAKAIESAEEARVTGPNPTDPVDQVEVSDRSRQFSASFKEEPPRLRLSAAELQAMVRGKEPKA